ncbi:uncharacterized protein ARMOST_02235 [Armillaria ostoyae]|uniref:HNH nuclease domain-containing protein n=1 Tax=Armillaria ostoyae TaxID=47428 RepID=A0A284QR84_ARMOS|nr:uncharacterized protein ARMOST_02235 [Armillaria ostoyae]
MHKEAKDLLSSETGFESTYLNEDSSNEEYWKFRSLSAITSRLEQLNGAKVHSLFNVMTMEHNVHEWFTRLEIWFEKTDILSAIHLYLPPEITFTTPDSENLPVPSDTCAKVTQFSGAAEYIDNQDRVIENLDVLAEDGSSAEVLSSALLRSMDRHGPTYTTKTLSFLFPIPMSTKRTLPLFRGPVLRPPTRLLKCSNRQFRTFFCPDDVNDETAVYFSKTRLGGRKCEREGRRRFFSLWGVELDTAICAFREES